MQHPSLCLPTTVYLFFTDSLYPFCALTKKFVLGAPEVIVGSDVEKFKWGENELFLCEGDKLTPVEDLLSVRVVLPRKNAPNLSGIPFLARKFRDKMIASECNMCLENDNRENLCFHNDFERSFVQVYTIYELL